MNKIIFIQIEIFEMFFTQIELFYKNICELINYSYLHYSIKYFYIKSQKPFFYVFNELVKDKKVYLDLQSLKTKLFSKNKRLKIMLNFYCTSIK